MFLASSSSGGAVFGAELTGDLRAGIYCLCLGFSAVTLGNKCAVWDTWLHLRHYEKPDLLLCRVDSLWQNSGDENLFHTVFFFVAFATEVLFSFLLIHSFPRSVRACVSPPSFWCCHCAFVLDPNIWNNQTWFNMISVFDDCLMHLHLGNVYQTRRRHEINISARLVFCLDEYFRAEPQIQAGVSMRNEALVDLTPALDMWKSDSFALI